MQGLGRCFLAARQPPPARPPAPGFAEGMDDKNGSDPAQLQHTPSSASPPGPAPRTRTTRSLRSPVTVHRRHSLVQRATDSTCPSLRSAASWNVPRGKARTAKPALRSSTAHCGHVWDEWLSAARTFAAYQRRRPGNRKGPARRGKFPRASRPGSTPQRGPQTPHSCFLGRRSGSASLAQNAARAFFRVVAAAGGPQLSAPPPG